MNNCTEDTSGMEDDPEFLRWRERNNHCFHPKHNPPILIAIPYGKRYRYVCPGCKKVSYLTASQMMYTAANSKMDVV